MSAWDTTERQTLTFGDFTFYLYAQEDDRGGFAPRIVEVDAYGKYAWENNAPTYPTIEGALAAGEREIVAAVSEKERIEEELRQAQMLIEDGQNPDWIGTEQ